jgi:hypothetical protein
MTFTKKQQSELETLEWFFPFYYIGNGFNWKDITNEDKAAYFLRSERGIVPEKETIGYQALNKAKENRGLHCETAPGKPMAMYEAGVLEGSVPYWTLLGGENPKEIPPRSVVDYMKKSMFRGIDADTIEECYQNVLKHWIWWRKILFLIKN